MRHVDGAHARVRVVVRVHAEAERAGAPERRGAPVIVVVLEAVHLLRQALFLQLGLLPQLPLLLLQTLLLQPPSLLPRHLLLVFLRVGLAVALVSRLQRAVLHGRQPTVVAVRVRTCGIENHCNEEPRSGRRRAPGLLFWTRVEREICLSDFPAEATLRSYKRNEAWRRIKKDGVCYAARMRALNRRTGAIRMVLFATYLACASCREPRGS